jgi:hypothetical protein
MIGSVRHRIQILKESSVPVPIISVMVVGEQVILIYDDGSLLLNYFASGEKTNKQTKNTYFKNIIFFVLLCILCFW